VDYLMKQAKAMLETLAALHEARMAHRLVDASNLLLTDNLDLKLADFGSAKLIQESSTVGPHTIRNYKRAVAPDVLSALGEVEPASCDPFKLDVWAFGKVLFEMTQLKCYEHLNTIPEGELSHYIHSRLRAKGYEALFPLISAMLRVQDSERLTAALALSMLKSDCLPTPRTPATPSNAEDSTDHSGNSVSSVRSVRYCSQCVVSEGVIQFCPACYEQFKKV
jgi:serine/threonine protein kinase